MFRFKLITREQNGVETGHLDEQNVENVVSNKNWFNAVMVKTGSCSLTNKKDQLQYPRLSHLPRPLEYRTRQRCGYLSAGH